MTQLDTELLRKISLPVPGSKGASQASIIAAVGPLLSATLASYDMIAPLRAAHFLAQCYHESDNFCTTIEYGDAARFARLYDNRADLGNGPGDGALFCGRGLIQLTGRRNYTQMAEILGLPLVEKPELAAEPANALRIACEFWKSRSLNALADQDDEVAVTWRVNGGFIGLAERRKSLIRTKNALGLIGNLTAAQRPVLRQGDKGASVASLQFRLHGKGLLPETSPIDGDFGPATAGAVRALQGKTGVDADGIVKPALWKALDV
jgi:putative chitinase